MNCLYVYFIQRERRRSGLRKEDGVNVKEIGRCKGGGGIIIIFFMLVHPKLGLALEGRRPPSARWQVVGTGRGHSHMFPKQD